jgi:hypothetical protein
VPSKRRQELMVKAAALEGVLWKAIAESREDNITVILDALATLIKRVSEYSMQAEAKEAPTDVDSFGDPAMPPPDLPKS